MINVLKGSVVLDSFDPPYPIHNVFLKYFLARKQRNHPYFLIRLRFYEYPCESNLPILIYIESIKISTTFPVRKKKKNITI